MEESLYHDPEYQLPEPTALMTARAYKSKAVDPLVKRLKRQLKGLLTRYYMAVDKNYRLGQKNEKLEKENKALINSNDLLIAEIAVLRKEAKEYLLIRKGFGNRQLEELLTEARRNKDKHKGKTAALKK